MLWIQTKSPLPRYLFSVQSWSSETDTNDPEQVLHLNTSKAESSSWTCSNISLISISVKLFTVHRAFPFIPALVLRACVQVAHLQAFTSHLQSGLYIFCVFFSLLNSLWLYWWHSTLRIKSQQHSITVHNHFIRQMNKSTISQVSSCSTFITGCHMIHSYAKASHYKAKKKKKPAAKSQKLYKHSLVECERSISVL